jgi:hypothetical protein
MAHAQKPDFVFRRNVRVHLNRGGVSVQSTTGNRGVRISGSNARYTKFRGSVKRTGYRLHWPVSPSLPLPCVTVCHHISNWTLPEVDRGSTRLQCLENSLWKRLWAYHRTDCRMNTVRVIRNSITSVVSTGKLNSRRYLEGKT